MFGGAGEWDQRLRIGERPAPTIEPDGAPKLSDCLELDRLGLERRLTEPRQSFPAPAAITIVRQHTYHTTRPYGCPKIPTLWDCARTRFRFNLVAKLGQEKEEPMASKPSQQQTLIKRALLVLAATGLALLILISVHAGGRTDTHEVNASVNNHRNLSALPPILRPIRGSALGEVRRAEAQRLHRFNYRLAPSARYSNAEMNAFASKGHIAR